jgi:hypothetical protein
MSECYRTANRCQHNSHSANIGQMDSAHNYTATTVHTFIFNTHSQPSSLTCMYIHATPAQRNLNKRRLLTHQQFTAFIPGFNITHHINNSPCFNIHWLWCDWFHRFCHLRRYWPRSRRWRLSCLERGQWVNTVPENADNGHPYKLIITYQTLIQFRYLQPDITLGHTNRAPALYPIYSCGPPAPIYPRSVTDISQTLLQSRATHRKLPHLEHNTLTMLSLSLLNSRMKWQPKWNSTTKRAEIWSKTETSGNSETKLCYCGSLCKPVTKKDKISWNMKPIGFWVETVCVCVCVRVRACACVRVCVRVWQTGTCQWHYTM